MPELTGAGGGAITKQEEDNVDWKSVEYGLESFKRGKSAASVGR